MKPRKTVIRRGRVVEKHHANIDRFRTEVDVYAAVPWAAPKLLYVGPSRLADEGYVGMLVLERHPVWQASRDRREPAALLDLIDRLHAAGWAHRDLHLHNVVFPDEGGVLLVDFELAHPADPSEPSYDLFGPEACSVPQPPSHWRPHYWDVDAASGVGRHWGPHGRELVASSRTVDVNEGSVDDV